MKHVLKLGMALLIAAIVLGFGACKFEDDGEGGSKSGVDFTNYKGQDAAIFVRNTTNIDLVAFNGTLSADNLLGGIPGGTGGTHGLSKAKNTKHFPSNQATEFAMVLITEDQYIENKKNLASLQQTPFTRVYVFYNSQGDNEVAYEISDRLGGSQKLRLINNTQYNVELRERGIAGPTLGYAPLNMTQTDIDVNPGQYLLYPVFKYYNKVRQQIGTIYPKNNAGTYYFWSFMANEPGQIAQLNLNNALTAFQSNKTLGAAWIIIRNSAEQAIEVSQGPILYTDAMGYSYFNPGKTQTLQINMASAGGTSYVTEESVGGLTVGVAGVTTSIKDNDGNTTFTIKSDYQYSVTVTGDANSATGFTAILSNPEGTPINFDDFMNDGAY